MSKPGKQKDPKKSWKETAWLILSVDVSIAVLADFADGLFGLGDKPMGAGAAAIAVVTFLGLLVMTLSKDFKHFGFREVIASTFLLTYLVIVSWTSFFQETTSGGTTLDPLTQTLITNFTTVTTFVLTFYFGSTVASEFLNREKRAEKQNTTPNSVEAAQPAEEAAQPD